MSWSHFSKQTIFYEWPSKKQDLLVQCRINFLLKVPFLVNQIEQLVGGLETHIFLGVSMIIQAHSKNYKFDLEIDQRCAW